jgi:hypothetical protein
MKDPVLNLVVQTAAGELPLSFEVKALVNAMYCDRGVVPDEMIAEIKDSLPEDIRRLGLASVLHRIPDFCKSSRYLLTTDDEIEVQGNQTCGEVEVVALVNGDNIFIGVGSDHCDRAVEPFFYYKPKQMAPRVLCPRVWRYEDVKGHWDKLELKAEMVCDGRREVFQNGKLAELATLVDLLGKCEYAPDGLVLYTGTPALPDYTFGEGFDIELNDPILGRSLRHSYSIQVLNQRP